MFFRIIVASFVKDAIIAAWIPSMHATVVKPKVGDRIKDWVLSYLDPKWYYSGRFLTQYNPYYKQLNKERNLWRFMGARKWSKQANFSQRYWKYGYLLLTENRKVVTIFVPEWSRYMSSLGLLTSASCFGYCLFWNEIIYHHCVFHSTTCL